MVQLQHPHLDPGAIDGGENGDAGGVDDLREPRVVHRQP